MKQRKQDRDRFQNESKSQAKIIDDEIRRFHEKYREVLRSKEEYERIDEDKTYSKLDVERVSLYTSLHANSHLNCFGWWKQYFAFCCFNYILFGMFSLTTNKIQKV